MVDPQNLQIFDGCCLVYLVEIAAELGVGQIGDPAQRGNRHLRLGKMLVHIVQRVFDGQKRGGMVYGGALLVQLRQNGIEHRHTLVIIPRALERPGLINGLEILTEYGGILGCKALGLQVFLIWNVQIDTKDYLLLGFYVVRAACRNK